MTKQKILSPKNSFKGWNFLTLLNNHKNLLVAALAFLVFLTLFIKMLVSPVEVDVLELVGAPSAAAGAVWTMLHGWFYFKNERTA